LGCDIVIKLIFGFYSNIKKVLFENYPDDSVEWILDVMKQFAKVELPEELNPRYFLFLCNTWKALQKTAQISAESISIENNIVNSIDLQSYKRLQILHDLYLSTRNRQLILYTKWIFQGSSLGSEFCANLLVLPRGLEFLESIRLLDFPVLGILSAVPDPTPKLNELSSLLNEPLINIKKMRETMDINNTNGKLRWIESHVKIDSNYIIICTHGQEKKYCLEKSMKDSKQYVLIDDHDKNTRPFGKNGFFVPSEGVFRLY